MRLISIASLIRCLKERNALIQEISDGHRAQKGARGKRDTEPLGPLGLGDRSRFGQWSLHRDVDPSILLEKEQVPTVGGWANRSIIAAGPATPDRFYIWGVRLPSLKERAHISISDVSDVNNIPPCFACERARSERAECGNARSLRAR